MAEDGAQTNWGMLKEAYTFSSLVLKLVIYHCYQPAPPHTILPS